MSYESTFKNGLELKFFKEEADDSVIKHTDEDIADAVYRVAPKIYYKFRGRFDRSYEKDDFVQDAYLHIKNLFDTGYIKPDRENIDGIIYSLLSSHFALNKIVNQKKDAERLSWDYQASSGEDGGVYTSKIDMYNKKVYGPRPDEKGLNPEQASKIDELVEHGKLIAEEIIDNMSFTEYSTKKHKYSGYSEEFGELKLSESVLAKLYLCGYTLQAVLEMFGFGIGDRHSQSSYITHKYQDVRNKVNDIIYSLDKYDKEALGAYVDSIESKGSSFQDK